MSKPIANFGTPYDINAINKLADKYGVKLSVEDFKGMTPEQVTQYIKANKTAGKNASSIMRDVSKVFRRNAKLVTSENFRQAELMHGTIRQGLAELGGLGAQIAGQIGGAHIAKAVKQNTGGGIHKEEEDDKDKDKDIDPNKGPINSMRYSFSRRTEE